LDTDLKIILDHRYVANNFDILAIILNQVS